MTWLSNWESISARIQGLLEAGLFFYKSGSTSNTDSKSVQKLVLLPQTKNIHSDISKFLELYGSAIPNSAKLCIENFLSSSEKWGLDFRSGRPAENLGQVQLALTSLTAFRSEFSYIIADTQIFARKITERAFTHLQRSIKVDSDFRKKWERRFNNTRTAETKCEGLGAVHLLSHGVWAFKIDAKGGKTDLVMQEPLSASEIERAAETLVLTEWKIVRQKKDLDSKIEEARKQTVLYATGVLSGIELRNYRYLVMISKDIPVMPEDREEDAITYRHINIAVSPSDPSKSARKKG